MKTLTRILCSFILAGLFQPGISTASTELDCPVENQIIASFDNGSGWNMCWDSRQRENIVLSDVSYQPADAEPYAIFNTLRLSQLHVSYDDSNVTYNDVTQFGLGGGYVSTLDENDCPHGRLIDIAGRAGICEQISTGDDSYSTASETRQSQSLSIFSTSQVGSYSYLTTWKFFADGSVQPSVGAAGALQRSSNDPHSQFGRQLEGVEDKSWLSHTHNYYWQIDFDLGQHASDDQVSEIQFTTDSDGRRAKSVTRLATESARAIDPQKMTSWLISDGDAQDPQTPGFLIEPVNYGHKHVSTVTEPHTEYDFFVTKQNDCERFVSENAKYYPECDENILEFVNDEKLTEEDIVVWHRISFHHVPRNEDRHVMHSHWDGFVMEARNLNQKTPGHTGQASERTVAAKAAASAQSDDSFQSLGNPSSGCSAYVSRNDTVKTGTSNSKTAGTVAITLDFLLLLLAGFGGLVLRNAQLRHKAQVLFLKPGQVRKHGS